jgi:hypothetical protein
MNYQYLNNYFEMFLEDKIYDGIIEHYRDLTPEEYKNLIAYIEQHELYDSILADIERWENANPNPDDDDDDDYDPSVMSDDLQDLCLDWFEDNIDLEAAHEV